MGEFGDERTSVGRVEQLEFFHRLLWKLNPTLPGRGNKDLGNAGEGASLRLHLHINAGADEEEGAGEEHEEGGDAEAESPAHAHLYPHYQGDGHHHGEGEREEVPIEEAVHTPPPGLRSRVELIGAECEVARSNSAGSDHQQGQPGEKEDQLPGRGSGAVFMRLGRAG